MGRMEFHACCFYGGLHFVNKIVSSSFLWVFATKGFVLF
jgi:hypothetical protein